jgi:poly-gamma-glutamate capsule biosynthesis protein CapA/YwtB (metallophosphatase superfamily)
MLHRRGRRRRHAAPPSRRVLALRATFAVTFLIGVVASLAAAPTTAPARPASPTATSGPRTSIPSSTTTARPPPTITLAFAGDTFFEGSLESRLAADPASVLAPVAPILASADVAMVNMETAIGVGGAPENKTYTFQAPPVALEAYRAAGVDLVSGANNHGMDYGIDSFAETLAAERASGFPIVGIGVDETEAYAPQVVNVRGHRVAFLAATQVIDAHLVDEWSAGPAHPGLASALRADRLVRAVAEAGARADTVAVYLHWGVERRQCATEAQRTLARQLVDAGADIVVGSHAHQLLGGGRMGDAVVHYGLGNFAFSARQATDRETGVFVVTATGRRIDGYTWVPARIVDRQPIPLQGAEADGARDRWEALRDCTDLIP